MSRIYQSIHPSGARMWVGVLDCGAWAWCRTQDEAEAFIRRWQRGYDRINLSRPREEEHDDTTDRT